MKRIEHPPSKRNLLNVKFTDGQSPASAHLATAWLRSLIERAQAARALREKGAA